MGSTLPNIAEMSNGRHSRRDYERLDRDDGLAPCRQHFQLPEGVVYLDGNSLGPLPVSTPGRLQQLLLEEWGTGLIRSWNEAGWIDAPTRVGDKIAALVGAATGEVVVTDSTSVNLFKLLAAAVSLRGGRPVVLTEVPNFPSDLYVAGGLEALLGARCELRVVERSEVPARLGDDVAVLMLTHVDFRTGEVHDMAALTHAAHEAGALVVWDLSHSAGAVPVDLHGCDVDLAVGCGYKYLNGGPGAPAYLYVAERLQSSLTPFLAGWMGHEDPFEFGNRHRPAGGVRRFLCGTPPILSMAALETAIDLWAGVDLDLAWEKSRGLTSSFIELLESRLPRGGFEIVSPRDSASRGAQVSISHPEGYRIMRALVDRSVIGDFRPPDLMRFGFAPLYTRFVDVWDAVQNLVEVMEGEEWTRPAYATRLTVT
jgi:kynureninase